MAGIHSAKWTLLQLDDEYADAAEIEPDDFIDDADADEVAGGYGTGRSQPSRRSTRTSTVQSRGRPSDTSAAGSDFGGNYRGERRSTRFGNAPKIAFDEAEQSLLPSTSKKSVSGSDRGLSIPPPLASSSAPTIPPVVAIPPPPGKKKSKFWYYAVEAVPGAPVPSDGALTTSVSASGSGSSSNLPPQETSNGHLNVALSNGGGSSVADDVGSVTENASLANGMEGIELTDAASTNGMNGKIVSNGEGVNGHAKDKMDIDEGAVSRPASRSSGASNMDMSDDDS